MKKSLLAEMYSIRRQEIQNRLADERVEIDQIFDTYDVREDILNADLRHENIIDLNIPVRGYTIKRLEKELYGNKLRKMIQRKTLKIEVINANLIRVSWYKKGEVPNMGCKFTNSAIKP